MKPDLPGHRGERLHGKYDTKNGHVGQRKTEVLSRPITSVLAGQQSARWRTSVKQALAKSKYDPSDILAKIVFWAAFLFVLQLALGVFGPNPISDLIHGIIAERMQQKAEELR